MKNNYIQGMKAGIPVILGFIPVGIAVASILAWFKCPAIICVIGAIIIDFILYLFI